MWKQDGIYTITASQGSNNMNKADVEVEIADGAVVPEFGTIASVVLVVAISSIIVLSAKGRLSFTPRI
jgi:predicted secreted protein with PEFG-CTERM motif